jgi:hypothetical protein
MQFLGIRRDFVGVLTVFLCVSAPAQEGHYGAGHDNCHQGFYSKLKRNDGQGPCCNLMVVARPKVAWWVTTTSQSGWRVGYPFLMTGLNNVVAPDGGARVCAPRQVGPNKGVLYGVILPSEG